MGDTESGSGPPHIANVRAVKSLAEQRVEPIYGLIRAVLEEAAVSPFEPLPREPASQRHTLGPRRS